MEVSLSSGSGKTKVLELRPTLLRKTGTTLMLKRTTSKQTYTEVAKKFGTFPFSLRQLSDEKTAKTGVLECVRGNVLRQYEVQGEKDGKEVSRVYSTISMFNPRPPKHIVLEEVANNTQQSLRRMVFRKSPARVNLSSKSPGTSRIRRLRMKRF